MLVSVEPHLKHIFIDKKRLLYFNIVHLAPFWLHGIASKRNFRTGVNEMEAVPEDKQLV